MRYAVCCLSRVPSCACLRFGCHAVPMLLVRFGACCEQVYRVWWNISALGTCSLPPPAPAGLQGCEPLDLVGHMVSDAQALHVEHNGRAAKAASRMNALCGRRALLTRRAAPAVLPQQARAGPRRTTRRCSPQRRSPPRPRRPLTCALPYPSFHTPACAVQSSPLLRECCRCLKAWRGIAIQSRCLQHGLCCLCAAALLCSKLPCPAWQRRGA